MPAHTEPDQPPCQPTYKESPGQPVALDPTVFKTRQVRDLSWAIFGPQLITDYEFLPAGQGINGIQLELTAERYQCLQQLDQEPAPLLQALNQSHSSRLGLYYERLWQFFIDNDAALRLLAANLRVYREKRTLGEFDLLYHGLASGGHYHLELANKYYLQTKAPAEVERSTEEGSSAAMLALSRWLGPNTRDRLDLKLARMLSHQLQLSAYPEGEQLLQEQAWLPLAAQTALTGYVFYRHDPAAQQPSDHYPGHYLDQYLDYRHNRGHWLPVTELESLQPFGQHWHILDRAEWLSPVRRELTESTLGFAQLEQRLVSYFSADTSTVEYAPRPQMIVALAATNGKAQQYYREERRFMITQASWPEA